MTETIGTIIVAIVSGAFILAGTFYTVRIQLKNDREQRVRDAAAQAEERARQEAVRAEENGIELAKLKKDLETDLWNRLQADYEEERAKRKEIEAVVEKQGVVIAQLKAMIKTQDERIKTLEAERDNWKQRALKAENGGGKKGM